MIILGVVIIWLILGIIFTKLACDLTDNSFSDRWGFVFAGGMMLFVFLVEYGGKFELFRFMNKKWFFKDKE